MAAEIFYTLRLLLLCAFLLGMAWIGLKMWRD